jgi:hypothetical protein
LINVFDDISRVFQSDRKTDQLGRYACGSLLIFVQL